MIFKNKLYEKFCKVVKTINRDKNKFKISASKKNKKKTVTLLEWELTLIKTNCKINWIS